MENILIILLIFSIPFLCFGKRLKRIEDRIARIEARQDADSMTRREDISDLSQRLDDVENWLNSSLTGPTVAGFPSEMSKGDADTTFMDDIMQIKASVTDDMLRVKSAFAEEKARWRREASDIEQSIQTVQKGLSSEIQTLVNVVKKELASEVGDIMTKVKDELASEIQRTVEDVKSGDVMDTLDTLQLFLQDTSTNCSASPLILNKLNTIEEMLVNHVHAPSVKPDKHATSRKTVKPSQRKIVEPSHSSCLETYRSGKRESGVYDVVLATNSTAIRVYCDMATDGGGWTVFQRRQDGSEDFYRGWDDYASGFGNLEGEFWLGNDYISQMTSECCHELRIDMEDFQDSDMEDFVGNSAYAKYRKFKLSPRSMMYRLDVSLYSGNAGDALIYHSGMNFTTKDKDNDMNVGNCAQIFNGAWWYKNCYESNLNGLFIGKNSGTSIDESQGMVWYSNRSPKKTEMKFRKI